MIAPTPRLLLLAGALTLGAWLAAAWRAGALRWTLAQAATLGYATLLTWRVAIVNRAGVMLPSGAVAPALSDPAALGLTWAWAIAVGQALTPRRSRPPAAELVPVLIGLGLTIGTRVGPAASLARGGIVRDGTPTPLLLALGLAASAVLLRGAVTRFAPTEPAGTSRWATGDRALAAAAGAITTLALAGLARAAAMGRGLDTPSTRWLIMLAALHALAAASMLFRPGTSRVPLGPTLGASLGLVAYVVWASVAS